MNSCSRTPWRTTLRTMAAAGSSGSAVVITPPSSGSTGNHGDHRRGSRCRGGPDQLGNADDMGHPCVVAVAATRLDTHGPDAALEVRRAEHRQACCQPVATGRRPPGADPGNCRERRGAARRGRRDRRDSNRGRRRARGTSTTLGRCRPPARSIGRRASRLPSRPAPCGARGHRPARRSRARRRAIRRTSPFASTRCRANRPDRPGDTAAPTTSVDPCSPGNGLEVEQLPNVVGIATRRNDVGTAAEQCFGGADVRARAGEHDDVGGEVAGHDPEVAGEVSPHTLADHPSPDHGDRTHRPLIAGRGRSAANRRAAAACRPGRADAGRWRSPRRDRWRPARGESTSRASSIAWPFGPPVARSPTAPSRELLSDPRPRHCRRSPPAGHGADRPSPPRHHGTASWPAAWHRRRGRRS